MTTKIGELLKRYNEEATPFTPEDVTTAWNARLADLGLDGVTVDNAVVDMDGKTKISLSNANGDFVEIGFIVRDEGDGPTPYAVTMGDEDGQGAMEMNLANANIPVIDGGNGMFVDMTNLEWLTDEIANALVGADDIIAAEPEIEPEDVPVGGEEPEPFEPGTDGEDDLLGRDDNEPEEKFVAIVKENGKMKARMVTGTNEHKVLVRRARAAFKSTFESMGSKAKKEKMRRRASIKPRRR